MLSRVTKAPGSLLHDNRPLLYIELAITELAIYTKILIISKCVWVCPVSVCALVIYKRLNQEKG